MRKHLKWEAVNRSKLNSWFILKPALPTQYPISVNGNPILPIFRLIFWSHPRFLPFSHTLQSLITSHYLYQCHPGPSHYLLLTGLLFKPPAWSSWSPSTVPTMWYHPSPFPKQQPSDSLKSTSRSMSLLCSTPAPISNAFPSLSRSQHPFSSLQGPHGLASAASLTSSLYSFHSSCLASLLNMDHAKEEITL